MDLLLLEPSTLSTSTVPGRLAGVWMPTPAFASDPATAHYYDQRAAEYDEWYTGQGSFADRDRPGWTAEVDQLVNLVRQLPPPVRSMWRAVRRS